MVQHDQLGSRERAVRSGARLAALVAAVLAAAPAPDDAPAAAAAICATDRAAPGWERQGRMTVLVDSVLLGASSALRAANPCRRMDRLGRPALMLRAAEAELRRRGRRVAPLVVVGLGYNSLWQRDRHRYRHWARRFDREAKRLLATLGRLGARQFVWLTLREPTPRTVPPRARAELGRYSWYFPYVNERLRRLNRRRNDLVLADWAAASKSPRHTYDSIHVNPRGARVMARVINRAIAAESGRQSRRRGRPRPKPVVSSPAARAS